MYHWDNTIGSWVDKETGKKINLPNNPEGPGKGKVIELGPKTKQDDEVCPGHKDPILILKKKIKVWAGSANKTETLPQDALILDLADKYSNGLRAEGLELPASLRNTRIVIEWPDMGKAYLFKSEWKELTDWLVSIPQVKENGLYVACLEGHGRTGTCISILAHYLGEWPKGDIVKILRKNYCHRAVETTAQIEYFKNMTGRTTNCQGSNFTTGFQNTTGGASTWKTEPCYKQVQGAATDCKHNCTATSSGHVNHWCRCKWDWRVDNRGLHERMAPGHPQYQSAPMGGDGQLAYHVTPGKHVVEYVKDGVVVSTETWEPEGSDIKIMLPVKKGEYVSGDKACWSELDKNLGAIRDCSRSGDVHLCGYEKGHLTEHMCSICDGEWPLEMNSATAGLCMARGGQETDHKCICTREAKHSWEVNNWIHTCSTCQKDFEEEDYAE